jgi:hypothetical protein
MKRVFAAATAILSLAIASSADAELPAVEHGRRPRRERRHLP